MNSFPRKKRSDGETEVHDSITIKPENLSKMSDQIRTATVVFTASKGQANASFLRNSSQIKTNFRTKAYNYLELDTIKHGLQFDIIKDSHPGDSISTSTSLEQSYAPRISSFAAAPQ